MLTKTNLSWDTQGSTFSLQGSGGWCIFGQEVPGVAARARTSKEKTDREAVGTGSDAPGAGDLAIFLKK